MYTGWNNIPYNERTIILEELAQYKCGRQGRRIIRCSVVREVTTETNNDVCSLNYQVSRLKQLIPSVFTNQYNQYQINGPVGSNHGSLQKPPLLALGHRALRDLPRCTVRGSGEREGL